MIEVRNLIRLALRSPIAVLARNLINFKPVYYHNVPHGSSCSDLFLWINDADWKTKFDVMNITSLCFPEFSCEETVRVLMFDGYGGFRGENLIKVAPHSSVALDISGMATRFGLNGAGTFGVLREMSGLNPFVAAGTSLSERGYVSFVKMESELRQFVHGNSYVLFCPPNKTSGFEFVRSNFHYNKVYRIQTLLDDCDSSECIFLNPTGRSQKVLYRGFGRDNREIYSELRTIPSLGIDRVVISGGIVRIEAISKVFMLRPVIRKNYRGGTDFFHA